MIIKMDKKGNKYTQEEINTCDRKEIFLTAADLGAGVPCATPGPKFFFHTDSGKIGQIVGWYHPSKLAPPTWEILDLNVFEFITSFVLTPCWKSINSDWFTNSFVKVICEKIFLVQSEFSVH